MSTPTMVPHKIEGLPTTGIMGTAPTIGVGTIVSLASLILGLIAQFTGFTLPPDAQGFFDEWGVPVAGIVAAVLTSVVTYGRVFSPRSAAEIKSGVRRG